ncbi:conserved hypothetical protein [Thermotomaculum hydrothermale]|uniref:Flavin reductase like domain-containing protein n=2 Tax=Thermotomaculum hydrothermale TaxID=981385 RepID=A0A7R6PRL6_9BACT|nr:flavin reductase [Thermotomaculum hydrothermale]BBB33056.1 conserved hypothetical protein [Thermotomaculum hydrothermale]
MFREVKIEDLKINPFTLIGKEWMLITAGKENNFNTMTASWGFLGYIWERNVAATFIRPTRYTYQFSEKYNEFTLCFFEEKHKEALTLLGTVSGRDRDKVKESGLTPVFDGDFTYFKEAKLVFSCKKLYFGDLDNSNFLDKSIEKFYPKKDYHRMYFGEIIKVLTK